VTALATAVPRRPPMDQVIVSSEVRRLGSEIAIGQLKNLIKLEFLQRTVPPLIFVVGIANVSTQKLHPELMLQML